MTIETGGPPIARPLSPRDKRKKYFLVIDIETANTTDDPLAYDVGFAICDRTGAIVEFHSYTVQDVFFYEKSLMQTCYYAEKLPLYYEEHQKRVRQVVNIWELRSIVHNVMAYWNIDAMYAYNAAFDMRGLNCTLRYVTKSRGRWFFPYGTQCFCIWAMACSTIGQQKTFIKWAVNNGKVSPAGNISTNAETMYAYISNQVEFEERHMGLADVEIECKLLAHCLRQHKKMDKKPSRACWQKVKKRKKQLGL